MLSSCPDAHLLLLLLLQLLGTPLVRMFAEPERKRSLQFLEFSVWEVKNTRSGLASLRNKFRSSKSFYINRSLEKREMLAVSDGELNHANSDGRGSDQSLNSLPSVQISGLTSDHSVASWAVSFERLLQDPIGVEYFTEFLKKEYSAENIFFWKSCEKFQTISEDDNEQLLQESRRIYDEYLSSSSMCPVNVDQQALVTEEMLEKPTPHLFKAQQQQIFNLMKFDSYARFVKSPLYQECMVSEVEGRPLPSISSSSHHHSTDCNSLHSDCSSHHHETVKKKSLRAGKSLPLGVEASSMDHHSKHSRRSFKKRDRNSNIRDNYDHNGLLTRGESEGSLNSSTSLDLSTMSTLSGRSENDVSSTNSLEPEFELKQIKYCCVYLPDGTASLTAVRPGRSIREMLTGVCEKRGYNPADVKVYLAGNDQKALALDQDCMVLTDQEVRLENRISFELQIESLNKNLHIVAKPTKTIHEALQSILKKYGLDNQHFVLKKMHELHTVDQGNSVTQVAGLTLILQTATDTKGHVKAEHTNAAHFKKDHSLKEKTGLSIPRPDFHPWSKKDHHHSDHTTAINKQNHCSHARHRPNKEIEGLVEMLNRVQSSRAEDQRGLLTKEDLVLPEFLRLPTDEPCDHCQMTYADNVPKLQETAPSGPDDPSGKCSEHNVSEGTKASSAEIPPTPAVTISDLTSADSSDKTCT